MGSLIILYADDDMDDQQWVTDACKAVDESLDLHFVTNGRQVLQYLKENELPTLVVLDLNMPVMDGKQTLKAIKNDPRYSRLPVAVVTTSSNSTDKEACRRLGATVFLSKPDTYLGWQTIVRRLLPLLITAP